MSISTLLDDTMADMTAFQIADAARRGAGVLLPIGVMEAHGPHLPTGTDAYIATQLCRLTRTYAGEAGRELIIAPPYYWGINHVLGEFAGSFNIRPETAKLLLTDVIDSLLANAFTDVLLVSHHGDFAHNVMIREVLEGMHARGHTGVRWLYAASRWKMIQRLGMTGEEPIWVRWDFKPELERFRVTGILGVHADEYETAAMVRYFPDTVNYEALKNLPPTQLTIDDLQSWRAGGEAARKLTPDGYFGAPNPIDPELWRHFDETARIMAAALNK
ncbi:MAG: creatinine amidohydrolase [Hyphomicrobiales bacterium]